MTDPRGSSPPRAVRTERTGTRLARGVAVAVLASAALSVFPSLYCARAAKPLLTASPEIEMLFVRGAAFQGEEHTERALFDTGSRRTDGEWTLATYTFTAMAAAQTYVRHAETFEETSMIERRAVERAINPNAHQFDIEGWQGEDALYSLGDDRHGHGMYLAYLGLALGWDRVVHPEGVWSDLHDGVVAALERRLAQAPTGVLASYPDEYFPADAAVAALAIDLHARIVGRSALSKLDAWEQRFRAHCIDPQSGLLWQTVGAAGKDERSRARASGTALTAWLLAGARPQLSSDLYQALQRTRYRDVLGFAAVREYAAGDSSPGDRDSGPLVLGLSPSATAFTLGAARAHRDDRSFTRLYASAHLLGAPVEGDQRRNFVIAGPLGDAILAAAVTSLDAETYANLGKLVGRSR